MKFLVSVLADTLELADPGDMAAIDAFNELLQANGHWVFAGGLTGPSAASVIDAREVEPLLTDGPFLDTKEHIAGFWILEAESHEAALALATAGSKACNRKVEVRPFLSL